MFIIEISQNFNKQMLAVGLSLDCYMLMLPDANNDNPLDNPLDKATTLEILNDRVTFQCNNLGKSYSRKHLVKL